MPSMPQPAASTPAAASGAQSTCTGQRPPDDLIAAVGARLVPVSTTPVVEAVREESALVFRCPYCRRKHYHGAHIEPCDPECACPKHGRPYRQLPCWCHLGAGNGTRGAHCTNPRSPYKQTGY